MVAFRIGSIELRSLDDAAFGRVLDAAWQAGGETAFPALFALTAPGAETDPLATMDELARLAASTANLEVAVLVGTLRDDLMTAVAAADEG